MPRNRITEKGRAKQGRGRGHGDDYSSWVKGGDFCAPQGNSRLTQPESCRAAETFPPHEPGLFYELLWRKQTVRDITDIREQYPLPLEKTLMICEDMGIKHPYTGTPRELKFCTVDYLVDVILPSGSPWHEIYDVVTELTLNTEERRVELLEVHRRYCEESGIPYFLKTEHQLSKTLAENVKLILRGADLSEYPWLDGVDLSDSEFELYELLNAFKGPFRLVAREWDRRLGLVGGSTLTMIWHFIWHQFWIIDMDRKIDPANTPLALLGRREGP